MTSPLVLGHFWVQKPNQSTYRHGKRMTRIGIDRTCCKNLTALAFTVREEFVTEVCDASPDETQYGPHGM